MKLIKEIRLREKKRKQLIQKMKQNPPSIEALKKLKLNNSIQHFETENDMLIYEDVNASIDSEVNSDGE